MHAFAETLRQEIPQWLQETQWRRGELTLYVAPEHLVSCLSYLRDHSQTQYKCLVDVTAVDYPQHQRRFRVVYHLLSVEYASRLRVCTDVYENQPLPSVTGLYKSAGWWEREVWDMFGVFFQGHPDLRRILTDYGFQGHPLRKDFPLTGFHEVRYCDSEKRVITEPVELAQEFRYFEYGSPWETLAPNTQHPQGDIVYIRNKTVAVLGNQLKLNRTPATNTTHARDNGRNTFQPSPIS